MYISKCRFFEVTYDNLDGLFIFILEKMGGLLNRDGSLRVDYGMT